jgi:hypothetical protein
MAGRGPAPKAERRRRNAPVRGDFRSTTENGWQHGEIPSPPDGLMPASVEAWNVWLKAWFAAHWTPDDLPALRQLIRLYDQVERGEFQRAAELRLQMDTYGITPKGQQDRRWSPPKAEEAPPSPSQPRRASHYDHLKVVGE